VYTPPIANCDEHTNIDFSETTVVRDMNCRELPLRQIRFILGPCVFYEFEVGNRKLYLFGESHEKVSRNLKELREAGANKYNSLSFQAFVHSLAVQNPTKTYDFMFEIAYFDNILAKEHDRWNSLLRITSPTLKQITKEFINCIRPAKRRDCPYKNLRTHYVDFRKRSVIINASPNLSPSEIQKEINTLLTSPGKVSKQINAIKDERIRNSFIDFFRDFVTNRPGFAGANSMAIMDIYAMARILRDFDLKKNNGVSSFQGTAQNVIYYTGANHTETFVRFLRDYLKLKPKATYGKLKDLFFFDRCQSFVDMGDLTKIGLA